MAKAESTDGSSVPGLNIEFMRSLVKQYSELGQWTSALFWADNAMAAGAAAGGDAGGDDVWLLASTMLARGELHRAAHAVTSRGLHKSHLLCLGVAMRAFEAAREPAAALALMDECDPILLEPRVQNDQTHNRALGGVLVCAARALLALERRGAAAAALTHALRADVACLEALHLLHDRHALTPAQESELLESLPISRQLGAAEAALVRAAYGERLRRHAPPASAPANVTQDDPLIQEVETIRARTAEAAICKARRLTAACEWSEALKVLSSLDPWCCADVRVACLVELRQASQLFALAHTLVDAYPQCWQAWYAVGCYYYLIGKSEFARRYLSKAKSLGGGVGCVWLAYGHSFAHDSEHDQAMAAYFKASQLMPGCHVPALYVGVECSLLNNVTMCERFLARAAMLYQSQNPSESLEESDENKSCWERLAAAVTEPHVAHEAACCALSAGQLRAAHELYTRALQHAGDISQVTARWAPTLDALGHTCRQLGRPAEALQWHQRALALRPGRGATYAAMGLCLALLGREAEAADALHSALARDPDDVVSLALLDAIVDRLDSALTEEEIPQFPFPPVLLSPRAASPPPPPPAAPAPDRTNTSDMSMSFD